MIGAYYSRLDDGRVLKSSRVLVRDVSGRPIGLLCVNFDITGPVQSYVREFMVPTEGTWDSEPKELLALDPKELVSRMVQSAEADVLGMANAVGAERNRLIIVRLLKQGVFQLKGAVDLVAENLQVSRGSIYDYLRDAKKANR